MSLFDKTTDSLGASLNFRLLRQNLINSNIANAETPGYHSKKLDFEQELARALDLDEKRRMDTFHIQHLPNGASGLGKVRGEIYDDPEANITNDKNTVDLEREMALLNENTIMYKAAVELIKKKLAALKYVVGEGNR